MVTRRGVDDLKRHEGYKTKVYKCSAGKDSIGHGYNLEANCQNLSSEVLASLYQYGIDREFAEVLLIGTLKDVEHQLEEALDFFPDLTEARRDVLCNMGYNLGVPGLLKFKVTLGLLAKGKYVEASIQMLQSKWAKQVGNRARYLANVMRTGVYQ